MKFAICNETFGDWPWSQGLSLARSIGYTGIEVAPFTLGLYADDISPSLRKEYQQAVLDHGMEIIGLHWLLAKTEGFHLTTDDLGVRRRTAEYMKKLVELCSDLGGNLMVLGSPLQRNFPATMTHDQAMANAAELLRVVVPELESRSIRIALEPLGPQEGNFLNRATQARELIEMIGSPQVQLHLDTKAMSSESEPIDKIIRDHADLMIHFHANDPNRLGPGMGDIDQKPIFKALRDIGYRDWISVEVFDYSPGPEAILRESWNAMQNAIALAD
ncbi:MAG: sugar phosphate isomerase/epimerase family protein [Pirellulaceae bacterium]|nr:sugar phosphate isomerase/epimerase family protein [Pirellulaceae bacterium]